MAGDLLVCSVHIAHSVPLAAQHRRSLRVARACSGRAERRSTMAGAVPAHAGALCVVVCGPSGCGKTYAYACAVLVPNQLGADAGACRSVGSRLAAHLGAPFLDADDLHSAEAKGTRAVVAQPPRLALTESVLPRREHAQRRATHGRGPRALAAARCRGVHSGASGQQVRLAAPP
jgi:hypothetical protein